MENVVTELAKGEGNKAFSLSGTDVFDFTDTFVLLLAFVYAKAGDSFGLAVSGAACRVEYFRSGIPEALPQLFDGFISAYAVFSDDRLCLCHQAFL